jgi:Spy/CpxP family protein refolding chaperone
MLRRFCLGLCFIFSLLGAFNAVAHAGPGQAKRDQIRERIRAMRIARLIQILDLDEKGAARLTPIIDRAYDQINAIAKDSGQARRELRVLVVAQPPDGARINRLIDRLLANKAKVQAIEVNMTADVRRVLAPVQVARLVVVLPEINHQIQQQIRRAAGLRPGAQPGPGQGQNQGSPPKNDEDEGDGASEEGF